MVKATTFFAVDTRKNPYAYVHGFRSFLFSVDETSLVISNIYCEPHWCVVLSSIPLPNQLLKTFQSLLQHFIHKKLITMTIQQVLNIIMTWLIIFLFQ